MNAVLLMEATTAAAMTDRYVRNNALQTLVRGFQVSQSEIRDVQKRLDARIQSKADEAAADKAAEDKAAEDKKGKAKK